MDKVLAAAATNANVHFRSPHQDRLLSLQKVTLYWLPIDRLMLGCFFLSDPFLFQSIYFSLLSPSVGLVLFIIVINSFCSPPVFFPTVHTVPQMPFDVLINLFFTALHLPFFSLPESGPSWHLLQEHITELVELRVNVRGSEPLTGEYKTNS